MQGGACYRYDPAKNGQVFNFQGKVEWGLVVKVMPWAHTASSTALEIEKEAYKVSNFQDWEVLPGIWNTESDTICRYLVGVGRLIPYDQKKIHNYLDLYLTLNN